MFGRTDQRSIVCDGSSDVADRLHDNSTFPPRQTALRIGLGRYFRMVNYKNILTILSNAPALPLQDVANVGQSLAIHAQITIANTRRASDLKRRSIGLDDQVVDERLSSIDVAKKRLKSQTYTDK